MDTVDEFSQPIHLSTSLVLLGIKHVGKTTLGQLFAARNHLVWMDLDEVILDRARESYNIEARSVRDVYRSLGREGFQEIETAAARYLRMYSSRSQIISTGGGIADNPPALSELKNDGILVYLQENEETLWQRIIRKGVPPFLDQSTPRESFAELYQRRDNIYQNTAQLTIPLNGAGIQEALEAFERAVYAYVQI